MRRGPTDERLQRANPFNASEVAALDLEPSEQSFLDGLIQDRGPGLDSQDPRPRRQSRFGWRPAAALTVVAIAAATAFVLLFNASSSRPSDAYAAEVVDFAQSSPLLLLEGPGWRVYDVDQSGQGPLLPKGSAGSGSMEFITGKPIPYGSIRVTSVGKPFHVPGFRYPVRKEREHGMYPPAVRQRKVELRWSRGTLAPALEAAHRWYHPHGQHWTKLPVLATTADVDTRAEGFVNQGGPGNHEMTAYWSEDGNVLELHAAVPDLAAFEERLAWLTKVDSTAWLDAMPAKVVKAADHDGTVREMLKGIPLPTSFSPSQIPDEGLTTDRYQVGASVAGVVSCLWFRQWGQARRDGDSAAAAKAVRAMASSKHWPILREMAKEGGYPALVWELANEMPQGYSEYAGHRRRLLPQAEGLNCARRGLPVLPWKQRRQHERESLAHATGPRNNG